MSVLGHWLLVTPIWIIGIVLYGAMIVAAWAGWKLRGVTRRRKASAAGPGDEDEQAKDDHAELGYIVSAVMGLLALLVGFTFALAIDRFDTRRMMVLDESNAIGTAYLRTQLLDEPHRTKISTLLRNYTENRIALAREPIGPHQQELLARSNAMITQLWSDTVDAFPTMVARPFSTSYISSINEMIDDDAKRQQARRSHVPLEVFVLLVVYQTVAGGVLGYVLAGQRGRMSAAMLLLLFGGALLLVIDIDRPTSGGIVEDQEPMIELLDMIKAQPPGSFGSAPTAAALPPGH
ncbi:hypothetical protein EDF56_102526 [Novosphingobium sp. PhB165]|uniref:bestrophin-like domain n=1 Tax=Novosphingobium sp. PhB165 TaxID=2485105 RepID=UPI00104EA768|nr:hypothetical protein [Novosphingobium sp. PhB165]TCM20863.1 hypothetical protein EDF56_102526 [Novosphingobium sp. PhB165]